MRGDYSYAPIKFMITKIVQRQLEENNEVKEITEQVFLDGNYTTASTITVAFKNGLKKGEYLLLYQTEFSDLHPMRKIVCSVYCEDPTDLKVIDSTSYTSEAERLAKCEDHLLDRLQCLDDSIEIL